MSWNLLELQTSLPRDQAIAWFREALPCGARRPSQPLQGWPVPQGGDSPGEPSPQVHTVVAGGGGQCTVRGQYVCLPLLEGMALFSPSCNCYHLFPSIVFVDVFLF